MSKVSSVLSGDISSADQAGGHLHACRRLGGSAQADCAKSWAGMSHKVVQGSRGVNLLGAERQGAPDPAELPSRAAQAWLKGPGNGDLFFKAVNNPRNRKLRTIGQGTVSGGAFKL